MGHIIELKQFPSLWPGLDTRKPGDAACEQRGTDSPAHPHSLLIAFVFRYLVVVRRAPGKNSICPVSTFNVFNTGFNRESPAHYENRIKPRVYVWHVTRSTMYEKAPYY